MNGQGYVSTDPDLVARCSVDGRPPKVVLAIAVREAFIHCAKALRRSSLWEPEHWPDRSGMPTIACMLVEHAAIDGDPGGHRTAAALEDAYATTLWN